MKLSDLTADTSDVTVAPETGAKSMRLSDLTQDPSQISVVSPTAGTPAEAPAAPLSGGPGEQLNWNQPGYKEATAPGPGMQAAGVGKEFASGFKEGFGDQELGISNADRQKIGSVLTAITQMAAVPLDVATRTLNATITGGVDAGTQFLIKAGVDPTTAEQLGQVAYGVISSSGMEHPKAPAGVEGLVQRRIEKVGAYDADKPSLGRKVANFVYGDVDPETRAQVRKIASEGGAVAPSTVVRETPVAQRAVEMAAGFGYDPIAKGAQALTERRAREVLKQAGVPDDEIPNALKRLRELAAPSTEEAGQAAQQAVRNGRGQEDVQLERESQGRMSEALRQRSEMEAEARELGATFDDERWRKLTEAQNTGRMIVANARTEGEAQLASHENLVEGLRNSQAMDEATLGSMLDAGHRQLDALAKSAPYSNIASYLDHRVRTFKGAVQRVFERKYTAADALAGNRVMDTTPGQDAVREFMEDLPDTVRGAQPALTRALQGMQDGEMTFGQLHYLRSMLRELGYSDKLVGTVRQGSYKHLSNVVDQIINSQRDPELAKAAQALAETDAAYAKEMPRFRDKALQQLADNMKSGYAPDPTVVAGQMELSGHSAIRQEVMRIAGPKGRASIRAAHAASLIDDTRRALTNDVDVRMLARRVDDLERNGVLKDIYGEEAGKVSQYVRRLAEKTGAIPLDFSRDTDFVATLQRANETVDRIKVEAKNTPVKMVMAAVADAEQKAQERVALAEQKAKSIEAQIKAVQGDARLPVEQAMAKEASLRQQLELIRQQDPLDFLTNTSMAAEAAAEVLHSDPRRLKALVEMAKTNSMAEKALKAVQRSAAEKILSPILRAKPKAVRDNTVAAAAARAVGELAKMTPEVQDILFPNGGAKVIRDLGQQLGLMYGEKTGSAPALALGALLSPRVPIWRRYGTAYAYKFAAWVVSHPRTVLLITSDLRMGGAARRRALQRLWFEAKRGWPTAAAGQEQQQNESTPGQVPKFIPWRERIKGVR